jgi:hypothetical protein
MALLLLRWRQRPWQASGVGRPGAGSRFRPAGLPGLGDVLDAAVVGDLPVSELEVLVQVDR